MLEEIEDLETKAPVVLVIDDAHWADLDSLRAMLFVVRRLVGIRVMTLFAQRSEDAHRLPEGLRRQGTGRTGRTITLKPLPAAEIAQLAAALGVPQLSGRAAARLQAHTDGNPLYITTLLAEFPTIAGRPGSRCCPRQRLSPRKWCTDWMLAAHRPVDWSRRPRYSVQTRQSRRLAALAEVTDLVSAIDEAADSTC